MIETVNLEQMNETMGIAGGDFSSPATEASDSK